MLVTTNSLGVIEVRASPWFYRHQPEGAASMSWCLEQAAPRAADPHQSPAKLTAVSSAYPAIQIQTPMPFTNIKAEDDEDSQIPPARRAAAASRSTWASVGVNVVLSTTQIVVGVLSKSQGLIADGKHCLSDLVADFVVLFANHASQKVADEDHPFGHQRFETAASLALG